MLTPVKLCAIISFVSRSSSTYILLAKTPNFVLAQQNTFYERMKTIWQEDPLQ